MKSPTAIHPLARPLLLAALLPLATTPATAALVVQTQAFSYSETGSGSTAGTVTLVGSSGVSESFNPFSASLGTLNAFQIVWDAVMGITGTTGAFNAGAGYSYNGTFLVDTVGYNGMGGGGGTPSNQPVGTVVSSAFPNSRTNNFSVLTANPGILATITGPNAFNLVWRDLGDSILAEYSAGEMSTYTVTLSGTVKLTYDYTEAPTVPVPGPLWYAPIAALLLWRRRRSNHQG